MRVTISTTLLVAVAVSGCSGDENDSRASGTCSVQTIASSLPVPYGIWSDGDAYLVTGGGKILAVNKANGEVRDVATLTDPSGSGLLRHGGYLWALDNPPGKLMRFDAAWTAVEVASGLGNPVDLDLDGDDFIVTDYDNDLGPQGGPSGDNGRVLRVTQAGDVQVLVDGTIGGPGAVNVQPEGYYVADFDGGRLLRIDRAGQQLDVIASGLGNPVGIRYRDGVFYVADFAGGSSGGRLLRVTKDGSVETLEAAGIGAAAGLAIEGDDFLVTDIVGGNLYRVGDCL